MPYALFDDAGKFLAGRVMSETDASLQVELDSGKRVKVKASTCCCSSTRRSRPNCSMARARWRPRSTSSSPGSSRPKPTSASPTWRATISTPRPTLTSRPRRCFGLFEAPHYFRRVGKGQFQEGRRETVQAALLAHRAQEGAGGADRPTGPPSWSRAAARRRFASSSTASCSSPTRTRPSTRPWSRPRARAQRAPLDLLQRGRRHRHRPTSSTGGASCSSSFPKGTAFPPLARAADHATSCRWPTVQAFSIDDSPTTEIDDALSVQGLGSGTVRARHPHRRAGPGHRARLGAVDQVARERLSTVYMPGYKITMLPDAVVQAYTLTRGPRLPGGVAVRARFDEATLELQASRDPLERVPIAANLRHDQLDSVITEALADRASAPADYRRAQPSWPSCFRLAQAPEGAARGGARQARELQPAGLQLPPRRATTASEPSGDETVQISTAPARRAAGPDRGRGHDPGQQHLGRLAGRTAACPASTAARPAWRRA